MLCFHCCLWAFSSCEEQELLFSCHVQASQCGDISCFRARAIGLRVSIAVVPGLSRSVACGIFPEQGSNLCPLAGRFLTTGPLGKSHNIIYIYIYFKILSSNCSLGFLHGSAGKESTCTVGDLGSIPGLGRSPGEGKGYPLQYSDLENPMNCIVYGVEKSRT